MKKSLIDKAYDVLAITEHDKYADEIRVAAANVILYSRMDLEPNDDDAYVVEEEYTNRVA